MTEKIDIGLKRCGQMISVSGEQCPCVASYRYTWPGRRESFICGEHVGQLRAVANAMSLPLDIIELELGDEKRTIGGR